MIPRNIRLAEAPSFGKPALFHDKESRGALAYLALAGEMIRREEVADHGSSVRPPPPALTARLPRRTDTARAPLTARRCPPPRRAQRLLPAAPW